MSYGFDSVSNWHVSVDPTLRKDNGTSMWSENAPRFSRPSGDGRSDRAKRIAFRQALTTPEEANGPFVCPGQVRNTLPVCAAQGNTDSGVQDRPSTRTERARGGGEVEFPAGRRLLGRFPFGSGSGSGSGRSGGGARKPHVILLGFADPDVTVQLQQWIEGRGLRLTFAATPAVALELIEDCVHLQVGLDGLLVARDIPGGHGDRVIRDLGREFPLAPVAITMGHDDLAMVIWARTRGIMLLEYPPARKAVDGWVSAVLRQWNSRTSDRAGMS